MRDKILSILRTLPDDAYEEEIESLADAIGSLLLEEIRKAKNAGLEIAAMICEECPWQDASADTLAEHIRQEKSRIK